ncbi:MAG: branched-chain amino acid ABC transporter substrate-binding protein [Calditrichaeota bacterium]|nr:branched-chain amino acid ABC transporter substrate-binding protein [Calditrichota bacterium]
MTRPSLLRRKTGLGGTLGLPAMLLLALVGCSRQSDTIRIAVVSPMTGESAKMGEDISRAVQLAVEEWNQQGGVLGRRIILSIEDDRADPKDAVSAASKVVAQGAVGVIGHYNSSCTIPASNIYHEAGIPMITPASTNPMVTDRGYSSVFRTCGRDDQQGRVEADFACQALNAQRIAILHDKTTYGQGLAGEFRKNLTSTAEVVFAEGVTRGDKDFSAVLTSLKAASPDLVMFGGLYGEGGLIIRQMRDLGVAAAFLSGDGVYDPEFLRIAGSAAEGAYLSYAPSAEGIPAARKFLESYLKRWPEVGPYSLFAYDATNILLKGIELAGTTDGRKVAATIHTNSFPAAFGTVAFDAKGDPVVAPYVMWIVRDGKLVPLDGLPKPVHVETH